MKKTFSRREVLGMGAAAGAAILGAGVVSGSTSKGANNAMFPWEFKTLDIKQTQQRAYENYFKGAPTIKNIRTIAIPDVNLRLNALKSVDLVFIIPEPFDKQELTAFGMIQRKFADMVIRCYESDSITYQSTGSIDAATEEFPEDDPEYYNHLYSVIEDHAIENSTNKIFSSEALWINADDGLQVLGGYGFSEEYPFARILRDERVNRIFEGTNEINKLIISGIVMKKAILEELPIREQILMLGDAWMPTVEIPENHPNINEIKAVELGRGIVLKTLHELILKHGQDFKNTQFEIASNVFYENILSLNL